MPISFAILKMGDELRCIIEEDIPSNTFYYSWSPYHQQLVVMYSAYSLYEGLLLPDWSVHKVMQRDIDVSEKMGQQFTLLHEFNIAAHHLGPIIPSRV